MTNKKKITKKILKEILAGMEQVKNEQLYPKHVIHQGEAMEVLMPQQSKK